MLPARERYAFGGFTLDAAERQLLHHDTPIRLAPKAHDLLVTLVRDAGRLVTKEDLLARVWPDTFVEEGILTVHISSLRKALAECDPDTRYIETVPRSGYRFVGSVTRLSTRATRTEPSRPLEASELFGRGRAHLLSGSFLELSPAVESFLAAIAIDPTYAAAHAGLALARCGQAVLRAAPHQEAFAAAKASALRALAMDSECADAQVALGTVLFVSEWDWAGAERSFQRALATDPGHTEANLHYGSLLEALGELDRGLQQKQRALERDPTSPLVLAVIAVSFWNQRRYSETILWAGKAWDRDPHHAFARELVAGAYLMTGDFDGLLATDIRYANSLGASQQTLTDVARVGADVKRAFEAGGHREATRHILQQHINMKDRASVGLPLVVLYAEAGDLDLAFEHLDRAIDARDPALVHLAVAPQWGSLRTDPRFDDRLARMGLQGAARPAR